MRDAPSRLLRRAACCAVFVGLTALVACSSDSDSPEPSSTTEETTTSGSESSSSTTEATTTTAPSTTAATTTTAPPSGAEAATAAWNGYWTAWAQLRAAPALAPDPLLPYATAEQAGSDVQALQLDRSAGQPPTVTAVEPHPIVVSDDGTTVVLEDCLLVSPPIVQDAGAEFQSGQHVRADVTGTADGWRVARRELVDTRCVPAPVATAAIDGWRRYWDARNTFWNPADPASPLVGEVMVDPHLASIVGLLAQDQAAGLSYRDRPELHPEVVGAAPGQVWIRDCVLADAAAGVFDATGARRDDIFAPIPAGQKNIAQATIQATPTGWKVADFDNVGNVACEFAPTSSGLPLVPSPASS